MSNTKDGDAPTAEQAEAGAQKTASAAIASVGGIVPLLLVASVVVLIQSSIACDQVGVCNRYLGYTVACGAVSVVAAIAYLIMERQGLVSATVGLVFAVFMFVWWSVGAIIITFILFQSTTNSYFATWIAFACSAVLAQEKLKSLASLVTFLQGLDRALLYLLLGSVVELAAAIFACSSINFCGSYFAWAVAVGAISTTIAMALIFVTPLQAHAYYVAWFLVILWLAGAGVNTFAGPFQVTGNGFFSSWICLIASGMLLQQHRGGSSSSGSNDGGDGTSSKNEREDSE